MRTVETGFASHALYMAQNRVEIAAHHLARELCKFLCCITCTVRVAETVPAVYDKHMAQSQVTLGIKTWQKWRLCIHIWASHASGLAHC